MAEEPADEELKKLQLELAKAKVRAEIEAEKKKLEPPDPAIAEAERQLKQAELDAKMAAERKKELESSLPTTQATALEGRTTIDDKVLIETETLAHGGLRTIAGNIAQDIRPKVNGKPLFIYNSADIGALAAYRAFAGQMKILGDAFDEVAKPQMPDPLFGVASIPIATAAVKSVIDLVALFRTDTDIKGMTVTLDELALVSEVAGALAKNNQKVFVSQLYPLDIAQNLAGAEVQKRLGEARAKERDANDRVRQLSGDEKEKAQKRLTELQTVLAGYDDALSKAADPNGTSVLGTLIRGEALDRLIGQGHVLYLKVLKAGGSNRVKRNLFTGSRLSHSGGAIANYILFAPDGSVAASRTLSSYTGYREIVPDTNQ